MTRTNNFNIWLGHWTPSRGSHLIYQRATARDCWAIVLATLALVMHVGSRGRCPFYRLIQFEMLHTGWGSGWGGEAWLDYCYCTADISQAPLHAAYLALGFDLTFSHWKANSQRLRWYQGCCRRAWTESWGQGHLATNRHINDIEQKRNYRWPAVGQFTLLLLPANNIGIARLIFHIISRFN